MPRQFGTMVQVRLANQNGTSGELAKGLARASCGVSWLKPITLNVPPKVDLDLDLDLVRIIANLTLCLLIK